MKLLIPIIILIIIAIPILIAKIKIDGYLFQYPDDIRKELIRFTEKHLSENEKYKYNKCIKGIKYEFSTTLYFDMFILDFTLTNSLNCEYKWVLSDKDDELYTYEYDKYFKESKEFGRITKDELIDILKIGN
jgi:hypothetical protein